MTTVTDFKRPTDLEMSLAYGLMEPWRTLLNPTFLSMDRIPANPPGPLLFVGNHTLYGMLDVPHLYFELYRKKDIWLRSMGDRAHFRVPGWRDIMERFGVVEGDREACGELLAQGEPVLVFPGGAREVAKRKGEKYQLVWKERYGFVKLAIEHGATIVPFAMMGGDDAWDIVWDAEDLMSSPLASLFAAAYDALGVPRDSMMPIAKGVGPSMFPKPVRLYFSIGEPIDAREYAGRQDQAALTELRDRVAKNIYSELDRLYVERKWDPEPSLRRRLMDRLLKSRFGR
ncbi:MAG: acyltransferase family protein [Proteobacteria bacterium]|nr:acyltransferase family protein [Pseudomonadota bacterium]MCP4916706.1 acyltransferase family protein [Pseudomonadota bacterium]